MMAIGAQGVISVASNIIPRQVSRMVRAFAAGRLSQAQKLHADYSPVFKDLFIETNPVPVKAALAMQGVMENELRLPLVPISRDNARKLRATLKRCKVLK
jgi:4-hydroxy-tetrahydrodipicolinate synthase